MLDSNKFIDDLEYSRIKNNQLDQCYMKIALEMSKLSKAKRKQVGAIIITTQWVLIPGVNGLPSGWSNECEYEVSNVLVTKDETLHAELNCILRAARNGVSILDSTLYVNLSPCTRCSAMIAQAGIKEVVYLDDHRDKAGLYELMEQGVTVRKIYLE